jgi:hypothetical protein
MDFEAWLKPPAAGWRVRIEHLDVIAVLGAHENGRCLILKSMWDDSEDDKRNTVSDRAAA